MSNLTPQSPVRRTRSPIRTRKDSSIMPNSTIRLLSDWKPERNLPIIMLPAVSCFTAHWEKKHWTSWAKITNGSTNGVSMPDKNILWAQTGDWIMVLLIRPHWTIVIKCISIPKRKLYCRTTTCNPVVASRRWTFMPDSARVSVRNFRRMSLWLPSNIIRICGTNGACIRLPTWLICLLRDISCNFHWAATRNIRNTGVCRTPLPTWALIPRFREIPSSNRQPTTKLTLAIY